MPRIFSSNHALGLVSAAAAILVLVVWIPLDIESGLVEKVRRQIRIGDALLPTLACGFVLVGALLLFLPAKASEKVLSSENLRYLLALAVILTLAFATMRWLGPAAVFALTEDSSYRALRDTTPWKHIGFIAGGTMLVAGLIAMAEGKVTLRAVLIGLLATLALIAIYDLPFEDLLLPPNGDV